MGGGYHGGFGGGKPKATDFYVGPNGQALPAKYKHWIGVSRRDSLLKRTKNDKLKMQSVKCIGGAVLLETEEPHLFSNSKKEQVRCFLQRDIIRRQKK